MIMMMMKKFVENKNNILFFIKNVKKNIKIIRKKEMIEMKERNYIYRKKG